MFAKLVKPCDLEEYSCMSLEKKESDRFRSFIGVSNSAILPVQTQVL